MGRKEQRASRALEKNPVQACNEIQRKVYPELFDKFGEIKDPRDTRYITYSGRTMLGTLYYKGIGGIESMQAMTRHFNDKSVVDNLYMFLGGKETHDYIPHHVTLNEYLEKFDFEELEAVKQDIITKLIRRKTFNDARVCGQWLVLVDGTELDKGSKKKNEGYLRRCMNKGTEDETIQYHRNVLEAKIYLGYGIVASIGTEWIENDPDYEEKSMSDAQIKQDCESKAFIRLAKKIKKRYPRLPICIVADALYVSVNAMKTCEENGWKYIIRYKEGAASSIMKEFNSLPRHESAGKGTEYANGVVYGKLGERTVNMLTYKEKKKDGKETSFMWITDITITEKNASKLIMAGRNRWKIENQGFNRQKHWQGNLEHACSWNDQAQKVHYVMEQIADIMKQLYELFCLKKLGIEKPQKDISSELLASFGRQLTAEDINGKRLEKPAFD